MSEVTTYTLRDLKNLLYSNAKNPAIIRNVPRNTELHFLSTLFPLALEEEALATLFQDYPQRNNPTRNKIFNGKYSGSSLQAKISELFSINTAYWERYVAHCTAEINTPTCDHKRLISLLLELTQQMKEAGTHAQLCSHTLTACTRSTGEALAILLLFVMLHSNRIGDGDKFGNINFLIGTILTTKYALPSPTVSTEWSYLDACRPLLKGRFQPFLDGPSTEFEDIYRKYSDLFSCTATLSTPGDATHFAAFSDVLTVLHDRILHSTSQRILYIEGPAGSHKNALMQLLFLRCCHACKNGTETPTFAPFYVNLNHFEKHSFTAENISAHSKKDLNGMIVEQFDQLLSGFKTFCSQHPNLKPLIFIDSIRNYKQSMPLDNLLISSTCLKGIKSLCFVENVDTVLTGNVPRRRRTDASNWEYYVKIHSVDLSDHKKAHQFFKCYSSLEPIPRGMLAKLNRLPFYTIDSYQLHLLLKHLPTEKNGTISHVYEQFCMEYLQYDQSQMDQAAAEAFRFAYTGNMISVQDYYTSPFWVLLRKHASFIDFFIARYYVNQLEACQTTGDVTSLNMILPKTITRFITSQIAGNIFKEEMILALVEEHYEKMGLYAQSEMTYWLGRIQNPNQKVKAIHLLRTLLQLQKAKISQQQERNKGYSPSSQKEDLFLLRGIMVSLIYQGATDISDAYIQSLIDDSLAAEINRGFHLEYYGDISYLPNLQSLNYQDDIRYGEKTLKQLFLLCDGSSYAQHPAFELSLFTICSLIQARIEVLPVQTVFSLTPYLKRLVSLLERRLSDSHHMPQKLREYYSMVLEDCQSALAPTAEIGPLSARLFRYYSSLMLVPRTGWVDHGIPSPESITEHIYNTWLMAFLMLPDTSDEDPSYDKRAVMDLLLIHDLGERTTGDISRPLKSKTPYMKNEYDHKEDQIMTTLLLKGTYPHMGSMNWEYALWKEWYENSSFNAAVAKEIDTVQASYQLCVYLLEHRDKFDDARISSWLGEYNTLKTNICRTIFETLILENHAFDALCLDQFPSLATYYGL